MRGNTFAYLNKPRPLLVVHSGKTTTGRSALLRMSSKALYDTPSCALRGTVPVADNMPRRETWRKPKTLERAAGARAEGEEIAAEPVPVRRPGVWVIGVDERDAGERSTASHTGRRKSGLKLRQRRVRWWY